MEKERNNTSDREISITKTLNAPIELAWEVWTNADHIKNWWGPDGFTTSIQKMDFKKDGEWLLIMHGPDGKDYSNKSIFKEIIMHKKIVYQHFEPNFIATIEFEDLGKQTLVHWNMLFESKEEFLRVIKEHKADEGIKQNVEKLSNYLLQNQK